MWSVFTNSWRLHNEGVIILYLMYRKTRLSFLKVYTLRKLTRHTWRVVATIHERYEAGFDSVIIDVLTHGVNYMIKGLDRTAAWNNCTDFENVSDRSGLIFGFWSAISHLQIGIRDRRVHECRLTFCFVIYSPITFAECIDVSYVCNGYSYCVVSVADNWTCWHAWRQKVRRSVNSWGKHAKTKRRKWSFTFLRKDE